jgi:hypothetical protein
MKRFTRRDLPAIVTGAAIVTTAALQQPLTAQATPDLVAKARESKRAAADELARFPLPMATEPAFSFKA